MKQWVKEHSLSIFLVVLLIIHLTVAWFAGYSDWAATRRALDLNTQIWPPYVVHYVFNTITSMVGDTYGALLIVLGAKYFYERRSPESGEEPPAKEKV